VLHAIRRFQQLLQDPQRPHVLFLHTCSCRVGTGVANGCRVDTVDITLRVTRPWLMCLLVMLCSPLLHAAGDVRKASPVGNTPSVACRPHRALRHACQAAAHCLPLVRYAECLLEGAGTWTHTLQHHARELKFTLMVVVVATPSPSPVASLVKIVKRELEDRGHALRVVWQPPTDDTPSGQQASQSDVHDVWGSPKPWRKLFATLVRLRR